MMNIHSLVRPLINFVNKDEEITLYHSSGQINEKGIIYPVYLEPIVVTAQVQNVGESPLMHSNKTNQTTILKNFFLDAHPHFPPAGLIRQFSRGGDFIQRKDHTWWLVIATPEEFSSSSEWVCVRAALQTIEPDFSRSPWFKEIHHA